MKAEKGLRPVVVFLNDGTCTYGLFHKFTQGNMANDAVIIEDEFGQVLFLDMNRDLVDPRMKFLDRQVHECDTSEDKEEKNNETLLPKG